jgi:hypothetical protein
MTTRYVAFVDHDEWGGFTTLESWHANPGIQEDIDSIVEFDGPDYKPGLSVEESDAEFEELKRLSKKAVEDELHKLPGQ